MTLHVNYYFSFFSNGSHNEKKGYTLFKFYIKADKL